LVHVQAVGDLAAVEWQMTAIALPGVWIERPLRLPSHWDIYPYAHATQEFGSDWARSRSTVALRVPSAVVAGEFNYVLNPEHPDFSKLDVGPAEAFRFDPRLFGERNRTGFDPV
jgi:RES domain-containing protein